MKYPSLIALSALVALPLGCDPGGRLEGEPLALRSDFTQGFVQKAFVTRSGGALTLVETPLFTRGDDAGPKRALVLVDAKGAQRTLAASTLERPLLDVALHPSGELTLLFVDASGYVLARYDAEGAPLRETRVVDPEIATDPPIRPGEPAPKPAEWIDRDAGRIAASDEDVIAALRTGRHSVVVYRFGADASGFAMQRRTLVVPAFSVLPIGLTGGSYDTFAQLAHRVGVYLDVDASGVVYVGTTHADLGSDGYPEVHAQVFGEALVGDPDCGDTYVTRLAPDGTRLGTSVVGTDLVDEMYGLRAIEGSAYVVGRNEIWNEAGTGHDVFVGRVDGATGAVETRAFDVALGDVAFDVARTEGGELVVFGASGYVQNPHGASISDTSDAFALVLGDDGSTRALALPDSARHDEARFARRLPSGALLVGGAVDGIGTHTADADLSRLYAHGFLRVVEP